MEQAKDFVAMKKSGRIAEITIDHPPLNTISSELLQTLVELVTACEEGDSVRAILLAPRTRSLRLRQTVRLF